MVCLVLMGIIITYYINVMHFNVQYDSGDEGKQKSITHVEPLISSTVFRGLHVAQSVV